MTNLLTYPGHDVLLPEIVRAENCYLYDAKGKRYVDLESGVWCTSIGHGNPRILRAIQEQATRIAHTGFNYSNKVVNEAARVILSLVRWNDGKCVFLCSGAEAVEYGVRVAEMISGRPLLMTMSDSYFGAYGSAHQRDEDRWFCFDWPGCEGCPDGKICDEHCERWLPIPFDRIGGFLFEPGSSSGFVRFPPEKLIRNIVRTIKEQDGIVLVNEVTTGVGRTGSWFGFDHYGIQPDIVALGKGIGNGYPVSVAAFAPGVIERLDGQPVRFATSHQNDPLGAAVVLEVIRTIQEEHLIERGAEIATLLLSGLEAVKKRTDRIEKIRARGLMLVVELRDTAATTFTDQTHRELASRGFVVARRPNSNVLRLDPALTIERADIDRFLETLEGVLVAGGEP